jgi:TPR repeat protein
MSLWYRTLRYGHIVQPSSARTLLRLALGLCLAAAPMVSVAVNTTLTTRTPTQNPFASIGNVDLMEAAFREGVSHYESGDYDAAARAWHAPANRGHPGAQFSLGVAHATGRGVATSLVDAIRWWQAAAAQDHPGAQLNLGLLYWRGEGVEKNLVTARMWWKRAAIGGDAVAQFQLGALAAMGEGEPHDYREAARWWRLSAAQGYPQAIKGLEILRSHGLGDAEGDASIATSGASAE